ncbi:MAG: hypothetical protein CJBNEKGG_01686 [Prosthecobacter sp.]|nr:hypothetical protein [Prosthecobacter sp.]
MTQHARAPGGLTTPEGRRRADGCPVKTQPSTPRMKTLLMKSSALACMLLAASTLPRAAAAPGDLAPLDAALVGDHVAALAVQPDGKMIIGGSFTSVHGVTRSHLARLNADGTLDMGFNPSPDNEVYCVGVQPDGKILVGGVFATWQPNGAASPVTRNSLARLNADGTLDTSFDLRPNGAVWCLEMQKDGRLLVGGSFTALQPNGGASVFRSGVARLDQDGSVDLSWVNIRPSSLVWTLATQADGKVVIGGLFTSLQPGGDPSPTTRNYIARLNADGTLDTAFDPNAEWRVWAVHLQPDGKVLIGGGFNSLQPNGSPDPLPYQKLARLNADGSLDTGFKPEPNGYVYSLGLQADGRILASGAFFGFSPPSQPYAQRLRMGRVNADGSVSPGFAPDPSLLVYGFAQDFDGRVLMGGTFSELQPNGAPAPATRNRLALVQNDAAIQSLSATSQDRLEWLRGGTAPEVSWVIFEESQDDGENWTPLGEGSRIGTTANWELNGLSLSGSGMIRARGPATGGFSNGSRGLIEQTAAYSYAPEIVVELPGGVQVVDGGGILGFVPRQKRFFTIRNTGSLPLSGLALTKDGAHSSDFTFSSLGATTLSPGQSASFDVTFIPGGAGARTATLHLASNDEDEGSFDIPVSGVSTASDPGMLDPGFGSGGITLYPSADWSWAHDMAVQEDGRIIMVGSAADDYLIIRCLADGTPDSTFDGDGRVKLPVGAGVDSAKRVLILADGRLVVAGTSADGANTRFSLVQLNPDGSLDTGFGTGGKRIITDFAGTLRALAVQDDGKLLVGGTSLARLNEDGTLDGTFGQAGVAPSQIDIHDIRLQADGGIIIAGTSMAGSLFSVGRLLSDGTPDSTFDGDGVAVTPGGFSGGGTASGLALQDDGKIVCTGWGFTDYSTGYTSSMMLVRYMPDGGLDPSFGTGGVSKGHLYSGRRAVLQPDGRIVVIDGGDLGYDDEFSPLPPFPTAVARFQTDGRLDPTFNGGVHWFNFTSSFDDQSFASAVAVLADGKILVGGTGGDWPMQPALARFIGAPYGGPDITVEQPSGSALSDGSSEVSFGKVNIAVSRMLTFLVRNDGLTELSGLSVSVDGAQASSFIATPPLANSLQPGAATTFTVTFAPGTTGWKSAALHVASNDPNETPFDIPLSGTGGIPDIGVQKWPFKPLTDGASTIDFGEVARGLDSLARLEILNQGSADLENISVTIDGQDASDFIIASPPSGNTISDTDRLTMLVSFRPSQAGAETATLHVRSNDPDEPSFDISLTGTGRKLRTGDRDAGFGTYGRLTTTLDAPFPSYLARNVTLQADGKFLVAAGPGAVIPVVGNPLPETQFHLLRYNADGTPDDEFGVDGLVSTDMGPGSDKAADVTVQPDGKILVAGNSGANLALARYLVDGSLDPGFGDDGIVLTTVGSGGEARAIILQPDGKIIVAGSASISGSSDFVVVRHLSDGGLDPSFGSGGIATFAVGSGADTGNAAALQADGKVVVAGYSMVGAYADFSIIRCHQDGSIDDTFGDNGRKILPMGNHADYCSSCVVDPDGRIAMGGIAYDASYDTTWQIARLTPEGALDLTFGDDGRLGLMPGGGEGGCNRLLVQPDGRLLATGRSDFDTEPYVSNYDFVTIRLLDDGSLDPAFGDNGMISTDFASDDEAFCLTRLPDGRLLIAGASNGSLAFAQHLESPGSPEIEVLSPSSTVMANGASYSFGAASIYTGVYRTFTIRNNGNADLILTSTDTSGPNSSEFAVIMPPDPLVAAGQSTTFQAMFAPVETGSRSATLEIISDDAGNSPFIIHFSGSGILAPEIDVWDEESNDLADGGPPLDFGTVDTGSAHIRTVTIRNNGSAELTGLSLSLAGPHAADFSFTQIPDSLLEGEEAAIELTFRPSAGGDRTATLRITSNDSDENPFDIDLTGLGVAVPEIVIESPQGIGLDPTYAVLDFGQVNVGASRQKTVFIRNIGAAPLTGLSVLPVGTASSTFSLSSLASTTLAPGAVTSFTITYAPVAEVNSWSSYQVSSNDADESAFDFHLTGIGRLALPPAFVTHPLSELGHLGMPVVLGLNAEVSGDPVITYQWSRNTKAIPGASRSQLTLGNSGMSDVGVYTLAIKNPVAGPVVSQPAYLGLITPVDERRSLKKGGPLSLACTVALPRLPEVSVRYQWLRDGVEIEEGEQASGAIAAGTRSAAFKLTKTTVDDSGLYSCRVTLDTPFNDPELENGVFNVGFVDDVPVLDPIPLPASASVSEPIDHTLTASNHPTSFSATGLPKGLVLNPRTGQITGRPTEASRLDKDGNVIPSRIVIKAANPWGTSLPEVFEMVIEGLDESLQGTYNGTVARSGHTNFGFGGHLQITLAKTGVISGSVTLAGQKHSVAGALDITLGGDPSAVINIKRPPSMGDLSLWIQSLTTWGGMTGVIIDEGVSLYRREAGLGDPAEPDHVDGGFTVARFKTPRGFATLHDEGAYVADTGNHAIRLLDYNNQEASTFAGSGWPGSTDGPDTDASFNSPEGLALDQDDMLFVADTGNATIRRVTRLGQVSTFAGSPGQLGNLDGTGAAARFKAPCALCFDPARNLYVVDRGSHTLRKITPAGVVTTLAGKADAPGFKDGSGAGARFNAPQGITYSPFHKALFVTDTLNKVVRKVSLTGSVSTYAGSPGVEGSDDGLLANARFSKPLGILSRSDGTIFVGDRLLRQINRNGTVATVSSEIDEEGHLDQPIALAPHPWFPDEALMVVHDRLHLVSEHTPEIYDASATFEAARNPWTVGNPAPEETRGLFNMIISNPDGSSPALPQGDGYAQVAIGKLGTAAWTGRTADGTAFTFSSFMGDNYSLPLHAMLYKNTGSLQGACVLEPASGDISHYSPPSFDWYKIPQPLALADRSYKAGFFAQDLQVTGGRYVPNNLHDYLGLSGSPAGLELDFAASTITGFQQPFTLTAPNTVQMPAPLSSMTLKIDPKTGIFSGGFKQGAPSYAVPFQGLLINYSTGGDISGHGHYLLPASGAKDAPVTSSHVRLQPMIGP